ncbi:hypothetical protein ACFSX9_01535 [Flavobacterium ardleyense]|uniref:Lipoprotein n=1 Tax=Flavobacterium ardleyense TaxID=2038737 RepID=A0ABW5Z441_9FLAO
MKNEMQKNIILITLTIFLFFSCKVNDKNNAQEIKRIFKTDYEHSLISRGNNFNDFNPYKDSLDYFLICLHHNIPIQEIIDNTSFTDEKIANIEKILLKKNWLKIENDCPKPTIFIADEKDGNYLYEKSFPIAQQITSKIIDFLPKIKKDFSKLELAKNDTFEKWSFLILSNVLLDSWQIDNVESEFLKAPVRPLRNNKNYYYSIMVSNSKTESFGIFGNQDEEVDKKLMNIYGNNRTHDISKQQQNYINKSDNEKLVNLANEFKPILINILNEQKKYIRDIYIESKYSEKISFEEFFIWWYHFIYTDVTNKLSKKGYLTVPEDGNFYYEIENE